MLVYVMRHGESENNRLRLYTGWFDSPLTDQGVGEAKKAGALMRSVSFDKIYSSDLKRAIETAEAAIPGCSYELSPLLREIKMGDCGCNNSNENCLCNSKFLFFILIFLILATNN